MHKLKIVTVVLAFLLLVGCANRGPWYEDALPCAVAGAIAGAGAGVGIENSEEAAGYGAAAGAVVGGALCAITGLPREARDSDGDGVKDNADQCPGTPAGVRVDAVGCPLDSDGDGVPDNRDQCPNTPAGVKVDNNGCPLDSDGDGVPDSRDKCPNTPAGAAVDNNGCPLDSDGDGVPDEEDQCPGTPTGVKVNQLGCPEKEPIVLQGVTFAFDSAELTGGSLEVLNGVAMILMKHPDLNITIAGHTDSTGTAAYNKNLSQRRAESVMEYLISEGIDPAHLTAVGYGEEQPIASNDTAEGRAQNRRVELLTPDMQ
jgi:Outer membrane protein and related peptidoglycan-associated (lipo)proteins